MRTVSIGGGPAPPDDFLMAITRGAELVITEETEQLSTRVRGGTVNFIFVNIQHVSLDGAKERCLTTDTMVVFCSLEVHT